MVEVRDALVESSIASEPEREKEGESGFQKKAFISGLDTPSSAVQPSPDSVQFALSTGTPKVSSNSGSTGVGGVGTSSGDGGGEEVKKESTDGVGK